MGNLRNRITKLEREAPLPADEKPVTVLWMPRKNGSDVPLGDRVTETPDRRVILRICTRDAAGNEIWDPTQDPEVRMCARPVAAR